MHQLVELANRYRNTPDGIDRDRVFGEFSEITGKVFGSKLVDFLEANFYKATRDEIVDMVVGWVKYGQMETLVNLSRAAESRLDGAVLYFFQLGSVQDGNHQMGKVMWRQVQPNGLPMYGTHIFRMRPEGSVSFISGHYFPDNLKSAVEDFRTRSTP